jgi:hypothetical protein
MTKRPSVPYPGVAALAVAFLLSGCGGGGEGSPPITLGGKVYGLLTNAALVVQLDGSGVAVPVRTASYDPAAVQFAIGGTYERGTPYALSIAQHPPGQICRIARNASGILLEAQADVRIECHRTVLNDTGIRTSDAALNDSPAMREDALVGRDAEASRLTKVGGGTLGFDFSRLCRSGDPVGQNATCPAGTPFDASNDWACTRDNVTGLVWVLSTGEYDPAAVAPPDGFCGQTGWRSPRVRELLSLVHAGKSDPQEPAIDLDYFPLTPAQSFRADETYADPDGRSWIVHFGARGVAAKQAVNDRPLQRWVAASGASPLEDTSSPDYRRTDAGSQFVVVDTPRELMWLVPKNVPAAVDWASAVNGVQAVNAAQTGGYDDWRLPNRAELESLVKRSVSSPALDPMVYGTVAQAEGFSQVFWSASPGIANQGRDTAWVVDFKYGDVSLADKRPQTDFRARVVYVRNRIFNAQ